MSAFSSNSVLLGVHVGNSGLGRLALQDHISPPHNHEGGQILRQLLKNALANEDLLARQETGGGIGPLDDFVFFVHVTDAESALAVIRTELDAALLVGEYQIGIRQDDQWVAVHPTSVARLAWLLDTERHEAALAELAYEGMAYCAAFNAQLRQYREENPVAETPQVQRLEQAFAQLQANSRKLACACGMGISGAAPEENPS